MLSGTFRRRLLHDPWVNGMPNISARKAYAAARGDIFWFRVMHSSAVVRHRCTASKPCVVAAHACRPLPLSRVLTALWANDVATRV